MIIDHNENTLRVWENSHKNLLIQARSGNGKKNKAKEIINQMSKLGHSVLLLTDHRDSWSSGLGGLNEIYTGSYEVMSKIEDVINIDLLVIDNASKFIYEDFTIEKINYKYILILSEESLRIPSFFNGKVIQLIRPE